MKSVHKFPIAGVTHVAAHKGAKVIHVGKDPSGQLCFWAVVDLDAPMVDYSLFFTGTGGQVPDDNLQYLYSELDGPYVWHVFLKEKQ